MPLSIGGAPRDPHNLWPEPRTGPNNAEQKDQLEDLGGADGLRRTHTSGSPAARRWQATGSRSIAPPAASASYGPTRPGG